MKAAVDRHWRYVQGYHRIEPEYLFTISVADTVAGGFNRFKQLDVEIHLEKRTRELVRDLGFQALGHRRYLAARGLWSGRRGKVDICLHCGDQYHLIELKKFDPTDQEVRKEVQRLSALLLINHGRNALVSAHIAFPALTDRGLWCGRTAAATIGKAKIRRSMVHRYEETGEDPMDGIPAYHLHVLSLAKQ